MRQMMLHRWAAQSATSGSNEFVSEGLAVEANLHWPRGRSERRPTQPGELRLSEAPQKRSESIARYKCPHLEDRSLDEDDLELLKELEDFYEDDLDLLKAEQELVTLSAEDRIQRAEQAKEVGNQCVKAGDIKEAFRNYDIAAELVDPVLEASANQVSESHRERAAAVGLALHLNMAQACLNSGDWYSAMEHANIVLKVDPDNHKARYRRAYAAKHLGTEAWLMQSCEDLKHLMKVKPTTEVKDQLDCVTDCLRKEHEQEKQRLALVMRQTFKSSGQHERSQEADRKQSQTSVAALEAVGAEASEHRERDMKAELALGSSQASKQFCTQQEPPPLVLSHETTDVNTCAAVNHQGSIEPAKEEEVEVPSSDLHEQMVGGMNQIAVSDQQQQEPNEQISRQEEHSLDEEPPPLVLCDETTDITSCAVVNHHRSIEPADRKKAEAPSSDLHDQVVGDMIRVAVSDQQQQERNELMYQQEGHSLDEEPPPLVLCDETANVNSCAAVNHQGSIEPANGEEVEAPSSDLHDQVVGGMTHIAVSNQQQQERNELIPRQEEHSLDNKPSPSVLCNESADVNICAAVNHQGSIELADGKAASSDLLEQVVGGTAQITVSDQQRDNCNELIGRQEEQSSDEEPPPLVLLGETADVISCAAVNHQGAIEPANGEKAEAPSSDLHEQIVGGMSQTAVSDQQKQERTELTDRQGEHSLDEEPPPLVLCDESADADTRAAVNNHQGHIELADGEKVGEPSSDLHEQMARNITQIAVSDQQQQEGNELVEQEEEHCLDDEPAPLVFCDESAGATTCAAVSNHQGSMKLADDDKAKEPSSHVHEQKMEDTTQAVISDQQRQEQHEGNKENSESIMESASPHQQQHENDEPPSRHIEQRELLPSELRNGNANNPGEKRIRVAAGSCAQKIHFELCEDDDVGCYQPPLQRPCSCQDPHCLYDTWIQALEALQPLEDDIEDHLDYRELCQIISVEQGDSTRFEVREAGDQPILVTAPHSMYLLRDGHEAHFVEEKTADIGHWLATELGGTSLSWTPAEQRRSWLLASLGKRRSDAGTLLDPRNRDPNYLATSEIEHNAWFQEMLALSTYWREQRGENSPTLHVDVHGCRNPPESPAHLTVGLGAMCLHAQQYGCAFLEVAQAFSMALETELTSALSGLRLEPPSRLVHVVILTDNNNEGNAKKFSGACLDNTQRMTQTQQAMLLAKFTHSVQLEMSKALRAKIHQYKRKRIPRMSKALRTAWERSQHLIFDM